jgi:ubiquinone biosynthesis UbiH/UbiF/VisC/COQ6 family hydroxylase
MTHHFFQSADKSIDADIIVVGAGLVGLAAAIAFAKQNKKVVLICANNPVAEKHQAWDARIYALTPSTETWLKTLDVWQHVDSSRVNPIHAMHLWDESGEKLVLRDDDANLQKLGVIVENRNLMHTLWEQVNALSVTVIKDAKCKFLKNTQQHITLILEDETKISAKLLVAADGVHSWVRSQMNIGVKQKSFNQTAIVANFLAEKNHQNIARQWFAPHETLALLPLVGKNVSLVWSVLTERADELLKLSNVELAEKVELQSKHELGDLKQFGKTVSFSLNQQTANALIAARVVLVGDAAHQIHPMAGQGVNLGFRDVMQLTVLATKLHDMQDIGDSGFLRQYERSRKADIATMNTLTSGLDYLFASDSGMMMKVRNWGLQQLNHQTTIKKLLIHQATA